MSFTLDRKSLQDALAEKKSLAERIVDSVKDEGKGLVITAAQRKDYSQAMADAREIRQAIRDSDEAKGIFEFNDRPTETSEAARDAAAGRRGAMGVKSLSEEWLGSDTYKGMKSSEFRRGGAFSLERGIPDLARASQLKDVYSAMGGTIEIPALGTAQNLGLTDRTLRPGRVRDLFPSERTNAAMLYGIRETGFTNNARTVAERMAANGTSPATGGPTDVYGLKPKSALSIEPKVYPIATIAHILYVHKNTLNDEPRIRGIIDRDMIDGVKMAEDEQILFGNGVGENLTGLMNTEGIQEYTGLASDRKSAQIRRAATRAILAYFNPTAVVLHPFDWEEIELETDNNGAYTVAVSVAVGGEKRVWRLQVSDSPAMTQGDALVGAFGTGAKLFDREAVNIEVSTENRDMFERNVYTMRAEERVGLVVDRPESFVHLNFTDFVRPTV